MNRVLSWFSCGAASAVATKFALDKYEEFCTPVYCDTMISEHPDNLRFFNDCALWFGREIVKIKSEKYKSIDEVFEKRRYMSGHKGALCTVEMKKIPRFNFQEPDDIHILGYLKEEGTRIKRFRENNPELLTEFILAENDMSKEDCLDYLRSEKIKLPKMYALGFKNNNCIGCVKATSLSYWIKVRDNFPDIFEKRVKQSVSLNAKIVRINRELVTLDKVGSLGKCDLAEEEISCNSFC
jgi:hypothetical protein